LCFFFQAEDGIRDIGVTGFRRVLFRSLSCQAMLMIGFTQMMIISVEGALTPQHLIMLHCPLKVASLLLGVAVTLTRMRDHSQSKTASLKRGVA